MKKNDSRNLLLVVLGLCFFGLLAIGEASAPQALNRFSDKYFFLKQQSIWFVVGVFAMIVASNIKYTFWEKIATPFFIFTVILLVLVLIPGFGIHALGARRWIDLGFMSFQPSELIKFSLCIYMAKLSFKNKSALSFFIPLILVILLIMKQPDLGTTLIVTFIGFSQIYLAEINILYFIGAGLLGLLGTIMAIIFSPYRKDRLVTFFETTSDPFNKGYHIRQILLSLGSGGIFGLGLGQSQQKFLYLPEASTDSIFAIIAEELGFLGSIVLIFIFLYLIRLIFKVGKNAKNEFAKIYCYGVGAWVSGQVFLNIGSMVSLVPLTGIPLPFISYGGTSLVMIMLAIGIVLGISRQDVVKSKNK